MSHDRQMARKFHGADLSLIAFMTLVIVSGPVGAQQLVPRQLAQVVNEEAEEDQPIINVFLPAPRELKQLLTRARKSLDDGRFSDAVAELGQLLNSPDAEDFFITSRVEEGTAVSLKAEAQRLIGTMPQQGRDSYELQFGADARRLLDAAINRGEFAQLTDVSRKFFHTQAGYESTILLGRHHLDNGRPLAAALSLQRVWETAAVRHRYEPELSVTLALAWTFAGMTDHAEKVLGDLQRRSPDAKLRVGSETISLFEDPSGTGVAWLESKIDSQRAAQWSNEHRWVMYRGNPARNASSAGGTPVITGDNPLVNCRWRTPIANDRALESEIDKVRRQYLADGVAALPGMHPLAVNDVVLMRTPRSVIAVDFMTGKRVWYFSKHMFSDLTEGLMSGPGGMRVETPHNPDASGVHQRLWDDAPFGQMSSDGEYVFFVDDLGSATTQSLSRVIVIQGGRRILNPVWPKKHNQLVALELASEGKLKWMIDGGTGEGEPKLIGAFFLGPPLPLAGQLYSLAEINGEIQLLALEAKTGRLRWKQPLIHTEEAVGTIDTNTLRRMAGASPSFADGVLVCPTTAGAVVAVDIATRSLLWGHQYKQSPSNPRRPGIWQMGRYQILPGGPGSRWADACITIAGGRVLMTPPESSELYCLNLLDGKLLWKQERDEDLFVACVHGEKVVLAGKNIFRAFDLISGEPAWPGDVEIPDHALPSGRGFYSDGHYFLPTTTAQLAKIDLEAGKVVETIDTGSVLGNLICYKENMISQGVDYLTAYYQRESLVREVELRLAEDANDAQALAHQATLLLLDRKRHQALQLLRRSYQLRADDATRALLVDTLLDALNDDFATSGDLAAEVEELIDQPLQRAEYLRLMTAGLQSVGKTTEAFATCLKLIADMGHDTHMEKVESGLRLRRDRWVYAQLASIMGAARPAELKAMNRQLEVLLDDAVAAESSEQMQNLINHLGNHPIADRARIGLARQLIEADEFLEAEVLLSQLLDSLDPTTAATAMALTAELLENTLLYNKAAEFYQRLADRYGDIVIRDGKTGRQLLDDIAANSSVGRAMNRSRHWSTGKVTVEEGRAHLNQFPSGYQRNYPLMATDVEGQAFDNLTIALDRQRVLTGRDDLGEEQFRISLAQDGNAAPYPGSVGLTRGKAAGHLLIISYGFEVIAIDTLGTSGDASDRIRWRYNLTPSVSQSGNVNPQIRQRPIQNPWGEPWMEMIDTVHGKPIGKLGSITDSGICFQQAHQLLCVDPLRGTDQPIWTRDGIEIGSDLFGDERYLFISPSDDTEAIVVSAADGSLLGPRQVPPPSRRWTTLGRNVLTWNELPTGLELQMYDPWFEENVWTHKFESGAKGWLIDRTEVAIMQPDGMLAIVGLMDGDVLIRAQLEPTKNLASIYAVRSNDQYVVAANESAPDSEQDVSVTSAPIGYQSPMIHGRVYALNRRTGQLQWPVPARIEQFGLPLDQPMDLPVLAFLRNVRKNNGRERETTTELLVLDRRDGRILLREKDINSYTGIYQLRGDPDKNVVSLLLPGATYTFQFTDDPVPPEPPAQTGTASSLNGIASTSSLSRVAGAILGALERSAQPGIKLRAKIKVHDAVPADADDDD